MTVTHYAWHVSYLHSTHGFGRNFTVTAEDYREAIGRGYDLLRDMGYNETQFDVTAIQRRNIVRRESFGRDFLTAIQPDSRKVQA